jgi:uncharacterized RDD family membrane protein YckC
LSDRNPYAPPLAEVRDPPPVFSVELASRASRLGASILDTIVSALLTLPPLFLTGYFQRAMAGEIPLLEQLGATVVSFALFGAANGYLMATAGQTVGKRLVGIRVVDVATSGVPTLMRQLGLRYGVMWFVAQIPGIGILLSLIDALFIFRSDRRCVHDLIARTKVVNA